MSIPVIPPKRSLGDFLGQQAGQGLSAGINQFFEGKQRQKQLGGLSPFLEAAGLNPDQIEQFTNSGLDPAQAAALVGSIQKANMANKDKLDKTEKATHVLNISNKLRDLIKYTGSAGIPFTSSFGGGSFNREAVQKRNQFDSLAASYASYFRDLETKGQLPQGLFEQVIKPRLPNSELSERENLGRIDGMEDLAKEYGGLNIGDKEGSSTPGSKEMGSQYKSEPKKSVKTINMRDPSTGQVYSVPQDQVNKYRKMGAEIVQ